MNFKTKNIIIMIIGILSIILGIICFTKDNSAHSSYYSYGGAAYTGIQNASAATANRISDLIGVAKLGFGSILLIGGLCLIVYSIPMVNSEEGKILEKESAVISSAVQENVSDDLPEI